MSNIFLVAAAASGAVSSGSVQTQTILYCYLQKKEPATSTSQDPQTHKLVLKMDRPIRGMVDNSSIKRSDPDGLTQNRDVTFARYNEEANGYLIRFGRDNDPANLITLAVKPKNGTAIQDGLLAKGVNLNAGGADAFFNNYSYFYMGLCEFYDSTNPDVEFEMWARPDESSSR